MPAEKAKAYFTGTRGLPKLNCAQAVAAAFKERHAVSDATISSLGSCGGGNAPDGHCGALHAARVILEGAAPQMWHQCRQAFIDAAGSTQCGEIRALKKLTCIGCVEKVASVMAGY